MRLKLGLKLGSGLGLGIRVGVNVRVRVRVREGLPRRRSVTAFDELGLWIGLGLGLALGFGFGFGLGFGLGLGGLPSVHAGKHRKHLKPLLLWLRWKHSVSPQLIETSK